jgi:branched-chain amino acid aminotransferase
MRHEEKMQSRKIWFKGEVVPVEMAVVSVLSPTAQFGLNVFEGIRCYAAKGEGGREQLFAFRLREHFERLQNSCKLIGIKLPYTAHELREHLIETIRANDYHSDTSVRMTLFVDHEGSWSSDGPAEMFIAPILKARISLEAPPRLRACISSWERISDNCLPPRIKAGANYVNARYAQLEAKRHGYDLPVFLGRDGKVSEGGGACLFMVRNGVLTTPTLTSSVLESITRSTVLQLARDMKMSVAEREIDRTELYLAEELFLCGSAAEITPLTSLDGLPIGDSLPGPITLALLDRYFAAVSNQIPEYSDWLTPIYGT